MKRLVYYLFVGMLLLPLLVRGQNMTVDQSGQRKSPMWLVQNILIGPNLAAFSPINAIGLPKTQASSVQLGTFNINNSAFGLDSGIVMVTTDAYDVVPGQSGSYSNSTLPASANLATVLNAIGSSSSAQHDRVGIEFSFVSPGDSVKFDYIFASKEYTSYTCSPFNDVFGFFLIGQGINGAALWNSNGTPNIDTVNLAVIPGTSTPVAVNTINQGYPSGSYPASNCLTANTNYVANSTYYNSNSGGTSILNMEGYTDRFTAKAAVSCGVLYTIKMMICDVSDGALNSSVFIGAKSFELPVISLNSSYNSGNSFTDSVVVEGCNPSYLVVSRAGAIYDTMDIAFNYYGNAIAAVDYQTLPSSITLLPGVTSDSIPIYAIDDGVAEGLDTIRIVMQPVTTACADYAPQIVEYLIRDRVLPTSTAGLLSGNDTISCPGDVVQLLGNYSNGEGGTQAWWVTDTLSGPIITVMPTSTTTYRYYVKDECMQYPLYDSITIVVLPYDSIVTQSDTAWICPGASTTLLAQARHGNTPMVYRWLGTQTQDSVLVVSPSMSTWFHYEVTDACGFIAVDSMWVGVAPTPIASFSYLPFPGNPLKVGFSNHSSDTSSVSWDFGDGNQSALVNPENSYPRPGAYVVTLSIADSMGCSDALTLTLDLKMDHYVYVANAFTPNGDVVNDRIGVQATGIVGIRWTIYNRWGLEVYQSDDLNATWDGTYAGEALPEGVYSYRLWIALPYDRYEERQGSIRLFR